MKQQKVITFKHYMDSSSYDQEMNGYEATIISKLNEKGWYVKQITTHVPINTNSKSYDSMVNVKQILITALIEKEE